MLAFFTAFIIGTTLPLPNSVSLIQNGSFEAQGWFESWIFEDHLAKAEFYLNEEEDAAPDGTKSACIINPGCYHKFYELQLKQLIPIRKGVSYCVSFYAKASKPCIVTIQVVKETKPWTGYGCFQDIRLSNKWQFYRFYFRATHSDDLARFTMHCGMSGKNRVSIDNVKVVPVR